MRRLLLLLAVASVSGLCSAPTELRFEAEAWSTPKDGWLVDQETPDHWCLWTTEPDAAKKRSGAQSLKTPMVAEDRATPEEGAPALHTKVTGVPNGTWDIELPGVVRVLGISFDGRTWRPFRGGMVARGVTITTGTWELWVDDKYANPDKPGAAYYDCLIFRPAAR